MAVAIFAAGCFWKPEIKFRKIDGVIDTAVGYAGGTKPDPSYQDVCTTDTGHAEVVRVEYDPETVSYEKLLAEFFAMHDPTQVNRQGPDVGSQYRSVIFAHDEAQKESAEKAIESLEKSGKFSRPVATRIEQGDFWMAEEYHQQYLEKQGVLGRLFGG